jgi:hypothetical protein
MILARIKGFFRNNSKALLFMGMLTFIMYQTGQTAFAEDAAAQTDIEK